MNVFTRGVRNAFRNPVRTFSLVIILGLSIGLALAMLIAHQAVDQKINSIQSSVGNTVSISPAGVQGFEGGGNPLTDADIAKVSGLANVTSVTKTLNDRLTSTDTNLVSAVDAGTLGRRFNQNNGQNFAPPAGASGGATRTFTPPVIVVGTNTPSTTTNGSAVTLKAGKVFSGDSADAVAIVGTTLATKNNLAVGSTFTAYGATVTVDGIFDSGNTFSNNQVIMPLKTVQTLSSQAGDVTAATITVNSVTNVDSVTSAVKSALGTTADVTNSAEQAKQTIQPLENIKSISLYSLVGAVIAGATIILLTMVMIVRERRREIGVLKAIGASNTNVVTQFTSEAVTLTILGSVVGIVLGVLAGNPITRLLVTSSTSSTSQAVPGAGRRLGGGFGRSVANNFSNIHGAVGWSIILYGLMAAIVIAILGSAVAAYFITNIRPAEVMRTE